MARRTIYFIEQLTKLSMISRDLDEMIGDYTKRPSSELLHMFRLVCMRQANEDFRGEDEILVIELILADRSLDPWGMYETLLKQEKEFYELSLLARKANETHKTNQEEK